MRDSLDTSKAVFRPCESAWRGECSDIKGYILLDNRLVGISRRRLNLIKSNSTNTIHTMTDDITKQDQRRATTKNADKNEQTNL